MIFYFWIGLEVVRSTGNMSSVDNTYYSWRHDSMIDEKETKLSFQCYNQNVGK